MSDTLKTLESEAMYLSGGPPLDLDIESTNGFNWQKQVPESIWSVWDELPPEAKLTAYIMAMRLTLSEG